MLRELPPLERTALDLAHSGGLAVPAIAQALGEDPADVRRALRAALLHIGRAASTPEPATAYATFLLP
jgi:DNA-directed RNA polymerase specialized sigma24 family protein